MTISHINYWDQLNFWKNVWKFCNGPLWRNKEGPFLLLNVAVYWQSSSTEACAKKLSQILANNIDNGGRRIGIRIHVRYCRWEWYLRMIHESAIWVSYIERYRRVIHESPTWNLYMRLIHETHTKECYMRVLHESDTREWCKRVIHEIDTLEYYIELLQESATWLWYMKVTNESDTWEWYMSVIN